MRGGETESRTTAYLSSLIWRNAAVFSQFLSLNKKDVARLFKRQRGFPSFFLFFLSNPFLVFIYSPSSSSSCSCSSSQKGSSDQQVFAAAAAAAAAARRGGWWWLLAISDLVQMRLEIRHLVSRPLDGWVSKTHI